MPEAIGLSLDAPGLRGNRLQQKPLCARRALPDEREVRILRVHHSLERALEVGLACGESLGHDLPERIRELLGAVRMAAGDREDRADDVIGNCAVRLVETRDDE